MRLKSAAVVVLGQILYPNGTMPGPLVQRVEHSLAVIQHNLTEDKVHVIYSGADAALVGRSEALCMLDHFNSSVERQNLLSLCLDITKHLEENSKNTVENALNCKPIIECIGCQCVWIVTNEFHMPRTKLIFESVFNSTNIKLMWSSADSQLSRSGEYRALCNRPADSNLWSLSERLDWEINALMTLNKYLAKYNLGPISSCRIDVALKELQLLR